MKQNKIMEECRQLITPEIKREVELSMDISDRIYEILQKQGKSQRYLADILGKRESEISKWLTGAHNFTTQTIARIETALGEPILEITGKQNDIEKEYVYVFVPYQDSLPFKPEECKIPEFTIGFGWNDVMYRLTKNSKCNY